MQNYEKMADGARKIFLEYDMEQIAKKWCLRLDPEYLYVSYIGEPLKIDRRTAQISVSERPPQPAGERFVPKHWVNETMILFDLLCRSPVRPEVKGEWASISSLGGIIGAGHARGLGHEDTWKRFAGKLDTLRTSCQRLGGIPEGKADVGYRIPVFENFHILLQFWDADDEFPAEGTFLFDANALQFMHYETLWYVMGSICERLEYVKSNCSAKTLSSL